MKKVTATLLSIFVISLLHAQTSNLITDTSIGGLSMKTTVTKATKLYPKFKKTGSPVPKNDTESFGVFYDFLNANNKVKITLRSEDGKKTADIYALDSSLKTKEGVCVGMALAELKKRCTVISFNQTIDECGECCLAEYQDLNVYVKEYPGLRIDLKISKAITAAFNKNPSNFTLKSIPLTTPIESITFKQ